MGDITDESAVDYLLRRGVPKDRATDAVAKITGGRMIELNNYANNWTEYASNAEYREPFGIGTNSVLIDLRLSKSDNFFKHLLKHGRIGSDDAKKVIMATDTYPETKPKEERAKETIQELLQKNVLAAHPDGTYTFHSRVVETFFRSA